MRNATVDAAIRAVTEPLLDAIGVVSHTAGIAPIAGFCSRGGRQGFIQGDPSNLQPGLPSHMTPKRASGHDALRIEAYVREAERAFAELALLCGAGISGFDPSRQPVTLHVSLEQPSTPRAAATFNLHIEGLTVFSGRRIKPAVQMLGRALRAQQALEIGPDRTVFKIKPDTIWIRKGLGAPEPVRPGDWTWLPDGAAIEAENAAQAVQRVDALCLINPEYKQHPLELLKCVESLAEAQSLAKAFGAKAPDPLQPGPIVGKNRS